VVLRYTAKVTGPPQTEPGGLYGDVVEDIDRSVGALLDALRRGGFLEDTLILFTSDNGPWYQGNPGFTRGRKNQTWEGGQRVPFIAHWPSHVASGVTEITPITGVDILPTVLTLLQLPLPGDRIIDGTDISGLLLGTAALPERVIYYYSQSGTSLDAVRDGRFKYHRRRGVRSTGMGDTLELLAPRGPWLFDLAGDAQESYDVSDRYPEHLQRLQQTLVERVKEADVNPRGWLRQQ